MQWSSGNFFIVAATWVWGASAAGIFRVAQSLIAVTHVWFQGLENVLPATAARLYHFEGRKSMLHYLRGVGTFWGGVTALFAVVILPRDDQLIIRGGRPGLGDPLPVSQRPRSSLITGLSILFTLIPYLNTYFGISGR